MVIIKGHGRLMAAQALGLKTVPVVVADYLSPEQARAARIADNRVAESEWVPEILEFELKALEELNFDLDLTGFDLEELNEILKPEDGGPGAPPPEPPPPEIDKAAELQKKWGTALGQIWQAGRHRLMCGDALQDFDKLLGGQKIDMVFTDPPYGANIVKGARGSVGGAKSFGSGGGPGGKGLRGWVGGGAAYKIPFGGKKRGVVHGSAKKRIIIKPGRYAPVIGDETTETAIRAAHLCLSLEIPILIFWGGNYYAEALPPSRCWLVWDKENTGNFADVELAWTNMARPARLFRHMWNGLMKASERGQARVHPTQKPVALAEWALKEFGKEDDAVADLFLGSGFTMIACERLKRRGFGMELSPEYVAVTLERLAQMGLEPKVIEVRAQDG